MINIVCLKWGDKFSTDYVNNLYYGIKRNTSLNFELHCFTENSYGIDSAITCHDLPNLDITGWWYKLWLFSDEMPFNHGDKLMFFDLDTIITGNIDDILSYDCPKDLVGLRNFYRPQRFASGLLMWKHGTQTHIWNEFFKDPVTAQRCSPDGDQEWTEQNAKSWTLWQEEFPDQIFSYKQSCVPTFPDNARIVCYHGTPSIIQSFTETIKNFDGTWPPTTWPKEHWRK